MENLSFENKPKCWQLKENLKDQRQDFLNEGEKERFGIIKEWLTNK